MHAHARVLCVYALAHAVRMVARARARTRVPARAGFLNESEVETFTRVIDGPEPAGPEEESMGYEKMCEALKAKPQKGLTLHK